MSTGGVYAVRRAADADQAAVTELDLPDLVTRKRFFGPRIASQLGSVIETSELALTLTDVNYSDRVLGFASFDDKPPPLTPEVTDNAEGFREYLQASYTLPRSSQWVFLSYFAQKPTAATSNRSGSSGTGAILKHLLHAAYQALPHRSCVLLILPLSVELEASDATGISKYFHRASAQPSPGAASRSELSAAFQEVVVYQSKSSDFVSSLHVRRARVEDHDDLEPILRSHNENVAQQFGDYFLAELIKDQDNHNVCLVAQGVGAAAGGGRAVGLLAVSDEIQVATLQQSFELAPYNNLAKTDASLVNVGALRQAPQIMICGPPAGGKGTQCELLVAEFGVVHLSTGDILRASIQVNSPLGLEAKGYMDAGELVPDSLIINVILERLQQKDCVSRGWLLDGFPRTASQAHAMLQLGIAPDVVVVLDVLDEEVVKRISGRRIDPETGKTYHLEFNPPPAQDEALRARLIQRSDDTEATIRNRLTKFHDNCDAVVDAFRSVAKILTVNGMQDKQVIGDVVIEEIHMRMNARKFKYLVRKQHLPPPKLIITGPPAGGKGTQCELLVDLFDVVHLSTGDMLRASIQAGAPLGMKAKAFMDAGELVPDELIIDVILERLQQSDCAKRGWLLDGFPRTAPQAAAMVDKGVVPDAVLVLDVPDEEVVQRIAGRRVDPVTGITYHVDFKPPPPEIRDRVIQRSDDNEATILNRLEKYHANCDQVLSAFADANVQIVRCDGLQPKPVIGSTFTAPEFQRMAELETVVAAQYPVPPSSVGVDGVDVDVGAAMASTRLWKRIEDAQATKNCFAITLFSIDDKFDGVGAMDLLVHAFAAFPDQDFCLLTLPTNAPEPSFIRVFTRVSPQPSSTFTHVLYLLHRDAIAFYYPTSSEGVAVVDAVDLTVQRLVSLDSNALTPFLQGVAPPTRASIQEDLVATVDEADIALDENPKHVAFGVYSSNHQLVGLALVARDHEITNSLKHYFQVESVLQMAHHRSKDHALLRHFVLNPVFFAASRFVLREIARQFRKSCLFYQVHQNASAATQVSPVIHELVLAPPRRGVAISSDEVAQYADDAARVAQQQLMASFALFVVSKKLLSEPKVVVNHRIIVVGASDTAIVCLQRLLSVPYLRFTNITVISPLGLASAPRSEPNPPADTTTTNANADPLVFARKSLLTEAELRQFSLPTHVRVVESKVMQIDRQAKAVLLLDGSCLPYDYLVVTAGLQDGTCTSLGRFPVFDGDNYAPAAIPLTMVPLGDVRTATWLHQKLQSEQQDLDADEQQRRRIAVYGSSLFALQVIHGLVDVVGVDGSRIVHISPARDSVFEDSQIKSEIDNECAKRGITTVYNTKIASLVVGADHTLEGVHTVPAASVSAVDGGPHSPHSHGRSHSHHAAPTPTVVPCSWLLCCQHNDADYDIFRAINESGLVYDGRLVVNGHMRTTDPFILAAGSLCRFSRRFIHAKLHEHYSPRECGELLASSLLRLVDPLSTPTPTATSTPADDSAPANSRSRKSLSNSSSAPTLGHNDHLSPTANANVVAPPEMHMPVIRTACVLGGKTYVQISTPSLINTLSLQMLPTRTTNSPTPRYMCLLFDDYGVLNRLEYLGVEVMEVANLQCLVGMHESYLNSALASFSSSYVDDWVAFFRQKWASALYHDRFAEFCVRLHGFLKRDDGVRQLVEDITRFFGETGDVKGATAMAQVRVGRGGDALLPSTKRIIESQALEFLSANREILAMYLLPRTGGKKASKPSTANG